MDITHGGILGALLLLPASCHPWGFNRGVAALIPRGRGTANPLLLPRQDRTVKPRWRSRGHQSQTRGRKFLGRRFAEPRG